MQDVPHRSLPLRQNGILSPNQHKPKDGTGSPLLRRFLPALPTALCSYVAPTLAPSKGTAAASSNRATCTDDHLPPRAVGMPRSLSAAAMARNDSKPAAWSSLMIGTRSAARLRACSWTYLAEPHHGARPWARLRTEARTRQNQSYRPDVLAATIVTLNGRRRQLKTAPVARRALATERGRPKGGAAV